VTEQDRAEQLARPFLFVERDVQLFLGDASFLDQEITDSSSLLHPSPAQAASLDAPSYTGTKGLACCPPSPVAHDAGFALAFPHAHVGDLARGYGARWRSGDCS